MSSLRFRRFRKDVFSVLACVAGVFVARSSLADHYYVPSSSMVPTVQVGDHVLVDKTAYGVRVPLVDRYAFTLRKPARGDVVVLESPESGTTLLKRVVAVPGDHVSVTNGQLEIDGKVAPLKGTTETIDGKEHAVDLDFGGGPDFGPITLPSGKYLVLGDNRGNSHDGRMFGLVAEDAILGRVRAIVWRDGGATWRGL
jgi:signal peptidase I